MAPSQTRLHEILLKTVSMKSSNVQLRPDYSNGTERELPMGRGRKSVSHLAERETNWKIVPAKKTFRKLNWGPCNVTFPNLFGGAVYVRTPSISSMTHYRDSRINSRVVIDIYICIYIYISQPCAVLLSSGEGVLQGLDLSALTFFSIAPLSYRAYKEPRAT